MVLNKKQKRKLIKGGASAYQKGVAAELRSITQDKTLKSFLNQIVHSSDPNTETATFADASNSYSQAADSVIIQAIKLALKDPNPRGDLARYLGNNNVTGNFGTYSVTPTAFANQRRLNFTNSGRFTTPKSITNAAHPLNFVQLNDALKVGRTDYAPLAQEISDVASFNAHPDAFLRWKTLVNKIPPASWKPTRELTKADVISEARLFSRGRSNVQTNGYRKSDTLPDDHPFSKIRTDTSGKLLPDYARLVYKRSGAPYPDNDTQMVLLYQGTNNIFLELWELDDAGNPTLK